MTRSDQFLCRLALACEEADFRMSVDRESREQAGLVVLIAVLQEGEGFAGREMSFKEAAERLRSL